MGLFEMRRRRASIAHGLILLVALGGGAAGCGGGGGGGGGSTFDVVEAVVEDFGALPLRDVHLNSVLRVTLTSNVDPDSVNDQTFRVYVGPDFIETAPGDVVIERNVIRFFPSLPSTVDLSDGGLEPGKDYRIWLRGMPDLNTVRSTRGRPLISDHEFDFSTRSFSPLYLDPSPGAPFVTAVYLDLDGDGVLEADGDPQTPEPEEFFEGEVFFDGTIPFIDDVRVGSVGLDAPHAPMRFALVFNEPLDPRTVLVDNDRNGVPDAVQLLDVSNPYVCNLPDVGSTCPRPLLFDAEFEQRFDRELQVFTVELRGQLPYAMRPNALHRLLAFSTITGLSGDRMTRQFGAAFGTGALTNTEDSFFEDFAGKSIRNSATTALWNPALQEHLKGGVGFGGDGSDGPFEGTVIDTTFNDGVFNFSSFVTSFDVNVTGDKPAIIRVMGDFLPDRSTIVEADGSVGLRGRVGDATTVPGGLPGPGGYAGGIASGQGIDTERGGRGETLPGEKGGGEGGLSGVEPGGGGGAGHAMSGAAATGGGDPFANGFGGSVYGDPSGRELLGGSGGGGGGNYYDGDIVSSGGSGGGGGGAMMIEAFNAITVQSSVPQGRISANGASGGAGATDDEDQYSSGGGGGGSGGTLFFRSRTLGIGATAEAIGRIGGPGVFPAGRGGAGAGGRIRIETIGRGTCRCNPETESEPIPDTVLGKSLGRSDFLLTNAGPESIVEYSFDGTNPISGAVAFDAQDLLVLDHEGNRIESSEDVPSETVIEVWFRAAFEDPENPNEPDPDSITFWTPDVGNLNGYPMIQWEVRFAMDADLITTNPAFDPPTPGVDDVRLRFRIR